MGYRFTSSLKYASMLTAFNTPAFVVIPLASGLPWNTCLAQPMVQCVLAGLFLVLFSAYYTFYNDRSMRL